MDLVLKQFADALHAGGAGSHVSRRVLLKVLCYFNGAWNKEHLDHALEECGMSADADVDYSKFIEWLFQPQPSLAAEYPIKCRTARCRSDFIRERWDPFREEVQSLLHRTEARSSRGFSPHEIMPSHCVLQSLVERCQALTREWHGRANCSYIYEMFMKMAERDGHSRYLFHEIPRQRSEDGFVRVLDGKARARLYSGAKPSSSQSLALVGRMKQASGESPIDNLQLPNLMRRQDALLLTVGRRVQQFFLQMLRWKQRRILRRWLPSEHEEYAVKEQAAKLQQSEECLGTSLALAFLAEHGRLIESYGQVPEDVRIRADEFIAECLQRPQMALEQELVDFVQHCQEHPGRPYKDNRVEHKLLLLKALRSPEVRVLWRSDIETFTQHRYIVATWTRKVPLYSLEGSKFSILRNAGDEECTRFRKNIFAYAESHGLGQSGGGWTDSSHWPLGSLMYELGSLLCVDDAAKLPNHFVTDIEKIVQDCVLLCPDGTADALPGEVLHDAGQNPIIASSIGKTQHTQVSKASVEDFPLMMQQQSPRWCEKLAAYIDIVQVGTSQDAFFVSARTRRPDAQPLLEFFVQLRLEYLKAFGRAVDFNCTCHASEAGEYYLNLAPLACMQKIKVPQGCGCLGLDFDFLNPESGETVTKIGLPVATVDCSHGKGNLLAASADYWRRCLEGKPLLTRLYDFNRKPGSLPIAQRTVEMLFQSFL